MRVLYFSRDYTTHDRRFLSKFAGTKHEVYYLRLENDGNVYEKRNIPKGILKVDWEGGGSPKPTPESWLRLMPALERILDSLQPDLVHAGPVQSCGFMMALTGFKPFMLMSWGSDILVDANRDEWWRWITRYTLQHSSMLLCDCDAVRNQAQQLVPYPDNRIVQFPWGIDLKRFRPGLDSLRLREKNSWDSEFILLSTRTWEPIYGISTLLEGFRRAFLQEKRLRLIMLGSGSLSEWVEEFILNHGLSGVVVTPGMISHEMLPNYFRAADAYISCSHSDGSSISLLEAMATGLPVLATDCLGNREWVIEGQNGWLFPVEDTDAVAEAMLRVTALSKHERSRILGTNRRVAEKRANWDINFLRLMDAYSKLEDEFTK